MKPRRKQTRIRNLRSHPELIEAMSVDERKRYARSLVSNVSPRKEADLQAACEELCAVMGIWCLHLPSYKATTVIRAGIPDLICCAMGYFLAVELKPAKGKVSPAQKTEHKALAKAGAWVSVCRTTKEFLTAVEHATGYPVTIGNE